MKSIRISGVFDNSGYGFAAKNTSLLLMKNNIDATINIIRTPMSRMEFADDKILRKILKYNNMNMLLPNEKAKINLAITVPVLLSYAFRDKSTYNILNMFWETDRISNEWIDIINNGLTNEIWVPCQSNYNALINSDIKKPIYIIPQYIKFNPMSLSDAQTTLPLPLDNKYVFYSVFQWSNRKNGEALLQAYFNEFNKKDDVILVIKTYGPSPFADRRWIKERILEIKTKCNSNAEIFLLDRLLTSEQVDAIAPQGHCYITTTRGEGWNLPLNQAMNYKQQIITTKTGGLVDWMNNDSAYIIPHTLVPIDTSTQAWGKFYEDGQKWADVKIEDIQLSMRQAYDERNDFYKRAEKYNNILNICSEENVINLIQERLKYIERK